MQSALVDSYAEQGTAAIKAQHDREARMFKEVICSTSLGGMARNFTAREQELAAELCGLQIGASSDLRDEMLRYLMDKEPGE
jgi:hypothetical protein